MITAHATMPLPTADSFSSVSLAQTREPVAIAAIRILEQCRRFIVSVPDHAFGAESRTIPGGTIGKHVRHCLDHFAAAASGIRTAHAAARPIEYDRAPRDIPMETSRSLAIESIADLTRRIAELDASDLDGRVAVRVLLAADGQEAELHSTLARELAFAAHHAIHHHAMMKAIGAEFGVDAEPGFGKAPATLAHESTPRRHASNLKTT